MAVTAEFAANATFDVLAGLVFILVGYQVSRRSLEGAERVAMYLFATWWYTLGAISITAVAISTAGALDYLTLPVYMAYLHTILVVLVLALFALAYYLFYLYTGRTVWAVPLALFYGAFYLWVEYLIAAANPIGLSVGRFSTTVTYENEDVLGGPGAALGLLFLAPQIIGAIAYGTLFFRAQDPMVRFRIAVVSLTLIGWFGSSILSSALDLNDQLEWWTFVSQAIGLVAALLILFAYRPPDWVRERLEPAAAPPAMSNF